MDDAEDSAADGEAVPAPGQPYTLLIRLHGGGIGYIALMRKPGRDGGAVYQRCRRLDRMVSILPRLAPEDDPFDWYLGLNAFKCATRRAEHLLSLRGSFIDLDTYNIEALQSLAPVAIWEAVCDTLIRAAIPVPQAVVFTGRGLQLVWAFDRGLPAKALPRWRAVQTELARALEQFGADHGALDVSRVLRLPGTVNQKSGRRAAFIYIDMEGATSFDGLAHAVLPVDRATIRNRREAKRDRRVITDSTSARSNAARAYVDAVLSDLRKLIAHRWRGRIPIGQRNTLVFMYGCLLARRVGMAALPSALVDFGRATTDLDDWELEQIAGSIASKLSLDGRGYRFSVARMARELAITAAEYRAAGLERLCPPDPLLLEERRRTQRERDRERKAAARRASGVVSRADRPRRGEPWKLLGVSKATWYRKYYNRDGS